MHRKSLTRVMLVLLLCTGVLLGNAAMALAAPAPWQSVDVTVHGDEAGGAVVVVSGQLPETTKLPAEVVLAVPTGGELQWAGEILGGAAEDDLQLAPTTKTKGTMDLYSFKLSKSRNGQVEVILPSASVFDGSQYRVTLTWVAPQDIPEVSVSARVPQGSQVTEPLEGADQLSGPANSTFYERTTKGVKAGDKVALAMAFTAPSAVAATGGATAGASDPTLALVLIGIVALAAMTVVFLAAGRIKRARSDEDPDDAETPVRSKEKRSSSKTTEEVDVPEERRPARSNMKLVIVALVIVAMAIPLLVAVVVAQESRKPQVSTDSVTQTWSQTEPCTTASIPLKAASPAEASAAAARLFAAIQTVPGIVSATVHFSQPSIEIGYCDSSSSEAELRQRLAATGMVDAAGSAEASGAPGGAGTP